MANIKFLVGENFTGENWMGNKDKTKRKNKDEPIKSVHGAIHESEREGERERELRQEYAQTIFS